MKWDELSPSVETAAEFAKQHINEDLSSEKNVLIFQLAHYGAEINRHFREDCIEDIDLEIADLISAHCADCDLVLYRGVYNKHWELMLKNGQNFFDGSTVLHEKAFLNCSLIKGFEEHRDKKLRIFIPKGTPVLALYGTRYHEVVVQRGAVLQMLPSDDDYVNCKLLSFVPPNMPVAHIPKKR